MKQILYLKNIILKKKFYSYFILLSIFILSLLIVNMLSISLETKYKYDKNQIIYLKIEISQNKYNDSLLKKYNCTLLSEKDGKVEILFQNLEDKQSFINKEKNNMDIFYAEYPEDNKTMFEASNKIIYIFYSIVIILLIIFIFQFIKDDAPMINIYHVIGYSKINIVINYIISFIVVIFVSFTVSSILAIFSNAFLKISMTSLAIILVKLILTLFIISIISTIITILLIIKNKEKRD